MFLVVLGLYFGTCGAHHQTLCTCLQVQNKKHAWTSCSCVQHFRPPMLDDVHATHATFSRDGKTILANFGGTPRFASLYMSFDVLHLACSLHSTVCTPQSTLVQTVPRCALYGCRYSLNHVVLSPMNSTAGEHIYTFDVDQHQAPVSFCMRSSQSSPTSHAATATNAAATFAPASLASLAANRAGVTKDADTVPPKRVLPSLSARSMKLKEQGNHHCAGKRWFQVIHSLPKRIA